MKHYIGIDLGTTNSAICSFDGKQTCIWKSPEQTDVTPSIIYADKKGHYFFGRKAFEMASRKEKNSASLFKRYLGTSKNYRLEESGITLTPVECSSMLLKVLYGYLPEEIRNDPDTVTVITVPAAFNQMKKDATLEAARLAGLGRTALMQEPVAAVMSVLQRDDSEKLFLIYDLGGGTFDISAARLTGHHVSLLAQGGKEMCGGRDIDRWIYTNRILPWLREHYTLPPDPDAQDKYLDMKRIILFAAEEAKIALSSAESAAIWLDEDSLHTTDEARKSICVDMTLTREDLLDIMDELAEETSELTQEIMHHAGITAQEVDQIVFIGGPTMYAPLRDDICRRLEIPRGTAVSPMTAVAEGAAIYAEAINWEDEHHRRKENYEEVPEEDRIRIRYEKRTASSTAKIAILSSDSEMKIAQIISAGSAAQEADNSANASGTPSSDAPGNVPAPGSGSAHTFDSGRVSIVRQGIIKIPLPHTGDYRFQLTVRDAQGTILIERILEITRTLASVESIPASHSIAMKALNRPGGVPIPLYLVEANDPLPKTGTITVHAAQPLTGGSTEHLSFSLWEGEIPDPVDDNRYIGTYKIPGSAFSDGVIPVGAEMICDYEINEAGNLRLGVSVPCVSLQMPNQNFYSRLEGQLDIKDTSSLDREINQLLTRTSQMKLRVVDHELIDVRQKLIELRDTLLHTSDPETFAMVESDLMDCYRRVALLHQRYGDVMKNHDLEAVLLNFKKLEKEATPDDVAAIRNLEDLARYAIDQGSSDFPDLLKEMENRIFNIRWRQDGYVTLLFYSLTGSSSEYTDKAAFDRLKAEGLTSIENKDFQKLRQIVNELAALRTRRETTSVENMFDDVTIYQ